MRFGLIALSVFLLDRISKWWIVKNFDLYESRAWIDGAVWLTYVHNQGAAFGIMPGKSWFFLIVAIVMITGVIMYVVRYPINSAVKLPLSLMIGGALGNLWDRLHWGYVIDFIDLHWWPVFNIADMAIVAGGILLAVTIAQNKKNEEEPV